jgi:4-amino-4-deoxy-L-arabinose transferase-like glycosyltransferase
MNIFHTAFLVFPIFAICVKEFFQPKISSWFVFIICILIGWLLWNLAVWQHFETLDALVRNTPNPSEELLDRWQSDGAPKVFALYFGWVFAAIYFWVCFSVIYIIRAVKKAL